MWIHPSLSVSKRRKDPVSILIVTQTWIKLSKEIARTPRGERGANRAATFFIELCYQDIGEPVAEVVPKGLEGGLQLSLIDGSGAVGIEALKTLLPVLDILPEASEFAEADRSAVIGIEHADHQPNSFIIERGPVA